MSRREGLLLGLLTLGSPAAALDPSRPLTQYGLDVWRMTDGLPQNTVTAVRQTRDGYLWLGTHEGLVRFDGLAFTVFDTSNSALPRTYIASLHETRDGALWIGSYPGGVTRFQGRAFQAYTTREGMSANGAAAIAEGPDGSVWLGTSDAGLYRLKDGRFSVYTTADGLPDNRVQALLQARDGSLWVGMEAGLARYKDGRFSAFGIPQGLPSAWVSALAEDREGLLWVGTSNGIARREGDRFAPAVAGDTLPSPSVNVLHFDPHGSLWIGTGGGLSRLREGRLESLTSREGLGQDNVLALADDHEGSLWIGTDGGGLSRLKDGKVQTFVSRDPAWQESVNAVAGDGEGGLWIAAYGGQLARLRPDGTITTTPSREALGTAPVMSLARDGDGLWLGTAVGLYRYDGRGFRSLIGRDGLLPAGARAILRDRRGVLWVGTDGEGVARQEGGRFVHYRQKDGLSGNRVRLVHEDRQGRIWVGTYGGLSLFQDGRFINYGLPPDVPELMVRALHEDGDGVFWLGTFGGGLFRFKDGQLSAPVTRRQGLLSDIVYGIAEDASGSLWMSCNKGIFRVAKRELDELIEGRIPAVRSQSLGAGDGMKSAECNGGNPAVWRMEDGSLWFPTVKGIVRVDPARVPRNRVAPPVVIEGVVADGQPLDPAGPARLRPGGHRLEIRYAGLSYLSPDRVQMAYKMDGFDPDWVEAGSRRMATYTNLPPGRYTFRVTARNEDGLSSEAGASLDIHQDPHFYQTAPFAVGAVLIVILGAAGAYRLRMARLRRAERELKAQVTSALADVKVLSGLLPVCASCKKIRDDKGYWNQIEAYIQEHSEAEFSHGVCPACIQALYPGYAQRLGGAEPGRG
jgi:ligand-binding sensor domain-containing protein